MTSKASAHCAGRSRWAFLILPAVLWATAASGQAAEADVPRLAISVNTHRPLAALATELEKRYQVVVTYEEGPWVAAADVEEVRRVVAKSSSPGKAAPPVRVMAPRKAAVSFEYALDPVRGRPTDYADLLSALLLQYETAGAPGKFRFEGSNGIYHLIPSRLENAKGHLADASPVFSTPVRLADQERTVDDTLDEIVAQLNESSPVKVGWGFVPLNLFVQTRIRLAADGVPARDVMHQILELLPRRVTWRLNYDPTTNRYYLSFLPLLGGR
ncbi:MAG TPA: hypothetical protein VF179_02700 [Thermoanaerobaculia bacterium]|nr:hypothetical protein [Thermoanaerobaculia bacterium]